MHTTDYGFNKARRVSPNERVDDITSREQDVSNVSLTEGQTFIDNSAFQMIDPDAIGASGLLPAKRKLTQNKKRNASNIKRTTIQKNNQLAPLQLGNYNGRGSAVGHKSAAPSRP